MMVQTKSTFFFLFSLLVLVPSISIAAPHPAFVRYRRQAEDAQKSNKLDPSQVMQSLKQDGQSGTVEPGQVRSLTSENNFINFCLTQDVPLTDGKQIPTGSCNQVPMGRIIAVDKIPTCKFVFPPNGDDSIKENEAFTVKLQVQNFQTGFFANPNSNYYANPQTVNDQGLLIGHGHVVIEKIPSFDHADTLNPRDFAFFKGLNEVAQNGILSAEVSKGLPAGFYRMSSINSATTHQPALASVAQHGSIDDGVYFEVKAANKVGSTSSADASASASKTASETAGASETAKASETASATSSADPAATSAADKGENGKGNGKGNNGGKDDGSSGAKPGATETSSAAPAASSAANNNDGKGNNDNGNGKGNGNGNGKGGDKDNENNGDNKASATSSTAPAETSAADNNSGGNNGGNGNNNNGNNGGNKDNGGGNGKNDNDGKNGGDAATPASSAPPAESSAADSGKNNGGNGNNGNNGNNGGGNNGGDKNQGGKDTPPTSSAAPQESASAGDNKGGKSGGRNRDKRRLSYD